MLRNLVFAALAVAAAATFAASARADQPLFRVMNTSETLPDGFWFRYGPDPALTTRTPGLGVYRTSTCSRSVIRRGRRSGPTAMCTWFVSNAPSAGGFPKSAAWTDQGVYHHTHGTRAEWLVDDCLAYIQSHYSTVLTNIAPALMTNAVPAAQPCDIIVYDWGQGDGKSHLASVISVAPGQSPEVAEMGQYDVNVLQAALQRTRPRHSTYTKRGWTWSAVHRTWLQSEPGNGRILAPPHPRRAVLAHILSRPTPNQ
jgi:hypothetical protein